MTQPIMPRDVVVLGSCPWGMGEGLNVPKADRNWPTPRPPPNPVTLNMSQLVVRDRFCLWILWFDKVLFQT